MANRPIQTPLPADLPTNWSNGQTVAPSGASVGLGTQYGYNYLMQQVNAAQQGVNSINAAFDDLAEGSDLPTATEIVYSLTAAYSGTVHQLTGLNGQTGILSCLFTAAAAYSSGDTFTVDGTAYTVKMQDGKDPTDGFFTAGAIVPVIVDTTAKTVNFKTGGVDVSSATASPSDVLAGKTFFSGLSDLIQTGTLSAYQVKTGSFKGKGQSGKFTLKLGFEPKYVVFYTQGYAGTSIILYHNGLTTGAYAGGLYKWEESNVITATDTGLILPLSQQGDWFMFASGTYYYIAVGEL